MATRARKSAPDPKALLDAANSASEKVATLHIAFLALCAYVLVIVFSTTDMDLLIGKGIKLPVVDVEVPIVGFYAVAPYLLVLVHFNLLLQLQLLSRKLYAFDDAAPKDEGIGGLHDQLNIFPYNYYLVGRPSRLVGNLVALVVTITMLLLPLAALLTLQARFLAYQSERVLWWQRAATWLDVVSVVMLWPVIMDRRDSWSAYIRGIWQRARVHWLRWLWGFFGVAIFIAFLTSESQVVPLWLDKSFVAWLLLTFLAPALRRGVGWLSGGRYFAGQRTMAPVTLGVRGLLTTLLLGLPLPLILVAEGERIDRPLEYGPLMQSLRHLDLHEKALFAKPPRPEVLADLRGTDPAKRQAALRSVERIDLQKRSLRGADLYKALMPMADLRGANLQGANLWEADLQGADLTLAQLQGAKLLGTQLQGADLLNAVLQGAALVGAQLQGASLIFAALQASDLSFAELQGADLGNANLQGADLRNAALQGASLSRANFKGAKLREATLYTSPIMMRDAVFELVDVRGLKWRPLSTKDLQRLRKEQAGWAWSTQNLQTRFDTLIPLQGSPNVTSPQMVSCLRGTDLLGVATEVKCKDTYSLDVFRKRLLPELEQLACGSPYILRELVLRFYNETRFSKTIFDPQDSTTKGLTAHLQQRVNNVAAKGLCPGLALLTSEDKRRLRALAEQDDVASRLLPTIGIDVPKR